MRAKITPVRYERLSTLRRVRVYPMKGTFHCVTTAGSLPGEISPREEEHVEQRNAAENDQPGLPGTTTQGKHERCTDKEDDERRDRCTRAHGPEGGNCRARHAGSNLDTEGSTG